MILYYCQEQASSNANIPSFNLANLFRVSAKPVLPLNSSQNFPSEETTPEVDHHENTRKAEVRLQ
ncbi:unnamed protein product [Clavelina lepadiformis]|uniref:Uncharacterized protein n=1 Tax=Clavelina lepadiformis TaxID=159417 RepID=A0ABP0F924_CLALP